MMSCPSARSALTTVRSSAATSACASVADCALEVAAGIFPPRPQHVREQGRRQFIVLGVGRIGGGGDRIARHFGDKGGFMRLGQRAPGWRSRARDQPFDAGARHEIGKGARSAQSMASAMKFIARSSCGYLRRAAAMDCRAGAF